MINAYLTDTMAIIRSGGYDIEGEPLTPTNIPVAGRFVNKSRLVKKQSNPAGEEVVASASIMLALQSLTLEDRILYNGVEYAIVSIEKKRHFSEVFLEVWVN